MYKKLKKSSDKMLAGVCSGIAEYLDTDPTVVRIIYAILSLVLLGVLGMLVYILLMVIIPEGDD